MNASRRSSDVVIWRNRDRALGPRTGLEIALEDDTNRLLLAVAQIAAVAAVEPTAAETGCFWLTSAWGATVGAVGTANRGEAPRLDDDVVRSLVREAFVSEPSACGFSRIAVGVRPDAKAGRLSDTRSVPTTTYPSGSGSSLGEATVADSMTKGLVSCAPETPLRNVARLMARHRVHAIYVFDFGCEDDETVELWGLVSDLDVVAATCGDIDERTARDSAVAPLVSITSDMPLELAARLMAEHGVSHLAVLDPSSRRPVGVLSTLDIARMVAEGMSERWPSYVV